MNVLFDETQPIDLSKLDALFNSRFCAADKLQKLIPLKSSMVVGLLRRVKPKSDLTSIQFVGNFGLSTLFGPEYDEIEGVEMGLREIFSTYKVNNNDSVLSAN